MKLGIAVFGLSAIAVGIVDLVWGAFDPAHQPIQAWGDHIAGQNVAAYVVGIVLAGGGAAVLSRRTARAGGIVVACVYFLFALFWLPRLQTATAILGHTAPVYIGLIAGICLELIVVAAALLIVAWASEPAPWVADVTALARWTIGSSAIFFGLQHLTNVGNNASFVPVWMPFGQSFWVILTGTAFVLSGVAILIHVLDALAAKLLGIMLLCFSAFTLMPQLLTGRDEALWGGNAYNVLAAASAWILGAWLAQYRGMVGSTSREYASIPPAKL